MATSHSALTPRSISKTDDASRKRSTADTAEDAPAAKRHQAVLGVSTTPTLQAAGKAANGAAQFRGEAPFAVQLGGLVGGMASKRRLADLQTKARSSLGTGVSSSSSRPATLTPSKGSMTAVAACPHVFRPVQLRALDDDLGDEQPHQAAGPGLNGLSTAVGSGAVADGPGAPAQIALGAAGNAAAVDAAVGAQPAPAQDTHAPASAQGQQVVAEQQPDVPAVDGISNPAVHMPAPTALHSTAGAQQDEAAGDPGVVAGSAPPAAMGRAAAVTPSTSSAAAAGSQAVPKPAAPTLGSAGNTADPQPGLLNASDPQKAAATAGPTLEALSGSMLASCNQAPAAATQAKVPAFSFAPFAAPAGDQSTAAYSTPSGGDGALSAPAASTPATVGFGCSTGMASFGQPTGVSSAAAAGSNSQPGKPAPSGAPGAWGLGSTSSRAPSGFNFGGQSAASGGTALSGGPYGTGANAPANTYRLPPAAGPTSSGFPANTAGGSSGIAFVSGSGQGVAVPSVPGGVGGVSGGMSSPAGGFGTFVAGPVGSGPPNGQPAVFGNAQPDIGAAAAGASGGFTAGNASGASAGAASRRRLVSRRRGK